MTSRPSDAAVSAAAFEFRTAIDRAGTRPWVIKHIEFPQGACGHASELLGRYLIERLGITAEYVNRVAHEEIFGWQGSHAWLEWDGLVIDVTGDQFGWDPVIVSREYNQYDLASDEVRHKVCWDQQRDWWLQECGQLWLAFAAFLPSGMMATS